MKIGFCGTMSVGKTTLVNALAELPEFKEYKFRTERSKYLMELGIPLNTDSTVKGQAVFLAERASELMNDDIITDRTIIDVMAFAKCSKSLYQISICNPMYSCVNCNVVIASDCVAKLVNCTSSIKGKEFFLLKFCPLRLDFNNL